MHGHRCSYCGFRWRHGDEAQGNKAAHTCSKCGRTQFWKDNTPAAILALHGVGKMPSAYMQAVRMDNANHRAKRGLASIGAELPPTKGDPNRIITPAERGALGEAYAGLVKYADEQLDRITQAKLKALFTGTAMIDMDRLNDMMENAKASRASLGKMIDEIVKAGTITNPQTKEARQVSAKDAADIYKLMGRMAVTISEIAQLASDYTTDKVLKRVLSGAVVDLANTASKFYRAGDAIMSIILAATEKTKKTVENSRFIGPIILFGIGAWAVWKLTGKTPADGIAATRRALTK